MANIGEGYSCPKGKGSVLVLGQAKLGLRDTYFRPEGSYSMYGAANIKYIRTDFFLLGKKRSRLQEEKKGEGVRPCKHPTSTSFIVLFVCLFPCFWQLFLWIFLYLSNCLFIFDNFRKSTLLIHRQFFSSQGEWKSEGGVRPGYKHFGSCKLSLLLKNSSWNGHLPTRRKSVNNIWLLLISSRAYLLVYISWIH